MQVTIMLDSGAFFEELRAGGDYEELEVGYFGSGRNVVDIRVLVDGNERAIRGHKLKKGTIEVRERKPGGGAAIEITDGLAGSLLKKQDLYPENTPDFDRGKFDCVLNFTSGRFCCFMVKERRFLEYDMAARTRTGRHHTTDQIAHNVAVHFDLGRDDVLELKWKGEKGEIFTTAGLDAGTKRVDIDIVADNSTAERLFWEALKFNGHKSYWLPNQGDPPTLGAP